jgi:hypothetical protein
VAFIYVRWRDYYTRVEGIIFFRSSIYLFISSSFLFIALFLGRMYNDHAEQKHNIERKEWTKQMDNDDGLRLSLLVWYDMASSHFYLKVNRLLWYKEQRMRKTFVLFFFAFKLVASKWFLTKSHMCVCVYTMLLFLYFLIAYTRTIEINLSLIIALTHQKKNWDDVLSLNQWNWYLLSLNREIKIIFF